jgi:hypothetical protein
MSMHPVSISAIMIPRLYMSDMSVILHPAKTSGAMYPLQKKKSFIFFFNHGTDLESLVFKGNAGQCIPKQKKRKAIKRTS